jgi:hypothetical protein
MHSADRFHEGELAVQRRLGEEAMALRNAPMISRIIVPGAISFLGRQTMVIFGSRDLAGDLWASPLFGEPGFVAESRGACPIFRGIAT